MNSKVPRRRPLRASKLVGRSSLVGMLVAVLVFTWLQTGASAQSRQAQGETIFVWTEGMAWKKGGRLAWQVYNKSGQPTAEHGQSEGVPAWSLVAAFARPDGGFTIVY